MSLANPEVAGLVHCGFEYGNTGFSGPVVVESSQWSFFGLYLIPKI